MEGALKASLAAVTVLAACAAAGGLFSVQVHPGFTPTDHALDLSRPEGFVLPGSGAVGASELGLLRWQGDRPLRLRIPGLGPPGRLHLKLLPECPDSGLELLADARPFAELALAPHWTSYELAPDVAGDVLTLRRTRPPAAAAEACPVHLSAVRTTTVVRRSSGFPSFWIVREAPGSRPPAADGAAPWLVGSLLFGSAAVSAAGGAGRLSGWLRLVLPGTVVLACLEALTRAADLRFVCPPASFPALLLLPGLVLVAWRHRRALVEGGRPFARTAVRFLRPYPAPTLGVVALLTWGAILFQVAHRDFAGDLRGLVGFGASFGSAELFPGAPVSGLSGYDGQFYAVLATDPLLSRPETLRHLDTPSFRSTRVLVPFLAWILALGRPEAAVWTYLALCWLLALGTIPLAARCLEDRGTSGWWAALLVLNAGLAVTLLRVTLDGAALFFLLAALAARRRESTGLAALAATAAALTREVFVLGGLALAAVELRRRRWRRALAFGLPPVVTLALWRLRVAAITEDTAQPVAAVLSLPFRWLPTKLAQLANLAGTHSEELWPEVAALGSVALAVAAALRLLPRAGRDPAVLTLLAFSCLVPLLSYDVYQLIDGYARILVALPFLCLIVSGDGDLPPGTRWWLRAVAMVAAAVGYWVVERAA